MSVLVMHCATMFSAYNLAKGVDLVCKINISKMFYSTCGRCGN